MSNNYGNYGGPPAGGSNQGQGGYPPQQPQQPGYGQQGGGYGQPTGQGGYGQPGGYPPQPTPPGYGQPQGYPPQTPNYGQPGYTQPQPQYGGPVPPAKPPRSNTPLILVGVGILALAVVGLVAFLVLGNKSSTPTPTQQAAASVTAGSNIGAATTAAGTTPGVTGGQSTPVAVLATATSASQATAGNNLPTVGSLPTTAATPTRAATVAATTKAAITAAATTRAATTAATPTKAGVTTPAATTGGITTPVYPGATLVQLPADVQSQFLSSFGASGGKNSTLKAYQIADDADTIKEYFRQQFPKTGWIDATSAASGSLSGSSDLAVIESAGGWYQVFTKPPNVAVLLLLPAAVAGPDLGASSDGNVLLVITASS